MTSFNVPYSRVITTTFIVSTLLTIAYICISQVNYAAADAIVALHIIRSLVELKLARQDKRELLAGLSGTDKTNLSVRSARSLGLLDDWLRREENVACLLSMCQGIVDMPYKQRKISSQVSRCGPCWKPRP